MSEPTNTIEIVAAEEEANTGLMSQPQRQDEEAQRRQSPPKRSLSDWLSQQSLPRLLGLFVGNTRDLERQLANLEREMNTRLEEKDAQLAFKDRELKWWRKRYGRLTDSMLLRQGMMPVFGTEIPTTANRSTKTSTAPSRIVSARSIEIDTEADRLLEMMQRGDAGVFEKIDDLGASSNQKDREVLKRFNARLIEQEEIERKIDIGTGVEIM